jgi:hypothetical protein
MEKPINVIDSGEYLEPHCFEKDREAILFHSYLDLWEYVEYLESENKKLLKQLEQ